MTKREVYTAIVNGAITDEVIEEVKGYITALDNANAKRTTKKNAEQTETDAKVFAYLTNDFAKASDIKNAINADLEEDAEKFSISKVVASCKRLEAEGKVRITEVRNGSRIVKSYALAE